MKKTDNQNQKYIVTKITSKNAIIEKILTGIYGCVGISIGIIFIYIFEDLCHGTGGYGDFSSFCRDTSLWTSVIFIIDIIILTMIIYHIPKIKTPFGKIILYIFTLLYFTIIKYYVLVFMIHLH